LVICLEKSALIGTLGEKSLHSAIKSYLEPDASFHEVKLGRHVADICDGSRIVEIQTGQFYKLRGKLAKFLSFSPVTVVYPVAAKKRVFWVDKATGEVSGGRVSPRRGKPWDILPELYQLASLLFSPGLSFCILMTELDEYRYADGWGKDNKRNASRVDRVPVAFEEQLTLSERGDFATLIPDGLGEEFTSAEFTKRSDFRGRRSWEALKALELTGAVAREGKRGKSIIYKITPRQ